MNQGVLYYNHGQKCLCRLIVSLFSLRKHYQGNACLAQENPNELPSWARSFLKAKDVQIVEADPSTEYGLVKKAAVWRKSPYIRTMFIDSDTVVLTDPSEFIGMIDDRCVVTKFSTWGTATGRMSRRIKAWQHITPELIEPALKYGHAINTGVMGWINGSQLLVEYESLTRRASGKDVARKTLDEIAMQLLVAKHPHRIADESWNSSCVYGGHNPKIIHYHGQKHCRDNKSGDAWKLHFRECVDAHPEIASHMTKQTSDRSVKKWLQQLSKPSGFRKDITVVTAVNPEYADRLKRNIELWMKLPGLMEQNFIVFVNGFKSQKERSWLDKYKNVRVIRWDYPFADASTRERMLAAFIHGPAQHVATDYWMKLDADASPTSEKWEWPKYNRHTITSHRWGFTKMKGAKEGSDHWFNVLDAFFSPEKPYFKKRFDAATESKVTHGRHGLPERFNSFCHIEKTSFTKRISSIIESKGGRLPIPTQDTISWYCATSWGESVKLQNMKNHFRQ